MLTKEFHSDTLSPGDKTHGFVYFKLKDKDLTSDKWFVHFAALDTATKTWITFNLPFEWKGRK
jgi:hypothetical protein